MARLTGGRTVLREELSGLLEQYYVRFYRDTLGLPDWRAKVTGRIREEEVEARRIEMVAGIIGRPLRDLPILNLGCGTGGCHVAVEPVFRHA